MSVCSGHGVALAWPDEIQTTYFLSSSHTSDLNEGPTMVCESSVRLTGNPVPDDSFGKKFKDPAMFLSKGWRVSIGGRGDRTGASVRQRVSLERSKHRDVTQVCLSVYVNSSRVGLISFGSRISHKNAGYGKAPVIPTFYVNSSRVGFISFGCSRISYKNAGYGKAPVIPTSYVNSSRVGFISFGCSRISHKNAGYGKASVIPTSTKLGKFPSSRHQQRPTTSHTLQQLIQTTVTEMRRCAMMSTLGADVSRELISISIVLPQAEAAGSSETSVHTYQTTPHSHVI